MIGASATFMKSGKGGEPSDVAAWCVFSLDTRSP
jgi:hypothetical protein